MGVKIAAALGAHVVLFTTSQSKVEDGKRLGAHEVVISKDPDQMAKHLNSFDYILNTVAASHDLDAFVTLLKRDGAMTLVGVPEHPHPSSSHRQPDLQAPHAGRLSDWRYRLKRRRCSISAASTELRRISR